MVLFFKCFLRFREPELTIPGAEEGVGITSKIRALSRGIIGGAYESQKMGPDSSFVVAEKQKGNNRCMCEPKQCLHIGVLSQNHDAPADLRNLSIPANSRCSSSRPLSSL